MIELGIIFALLRGRLLGILARPCYFPSGAAAGDVRGAAGVRFCTRSHVINVGPVAVDLRSETTNGKSQVARKRSVRHALRAGRMSKGRVGAGSDGKLRAPREETGGEREPAASSNSERDGGAEANGEGERDEGAEEAMERASRSRAPRARKEASPS